MLLNGPVKKVEPIIFESITASKIKDLLGKMKGSSGPSGLDVDQWKQLLLSRNFAQNGDDLANAIANMTKILATERIKERLLTTIHCMPLNPIRQKPRIKAHWNRRSLTKINWESYSRHTEARYSTIRWM